MAAPNRLFVANPGVNTVSVYPVGKFGNVPSLVTDSKLTVPSGIARDSAGRIYVANSGGDTITVFAAGASGTPNPNAMIFGSRTGLANPTGIALDSKGNIYVTNLGRNSDASVTVYPRGSNGNVPPTAVIAGPRTGLTQPLGLALDRTGSIYVINQLSSLNGLGKAMTLSESVIVYNGGSKGNVAPIRILAGSKTGFLSPRGIAVDAGGSIYVANDDSGNSHFEGAIEIFPPRSAGNVAPATTISDSCSGLNGPVDVAVGSSGDIYVANDGARTYPAAPPRITVYAADRIGTACTTPAATICGAATGLHQPTSLTVDSRSNIYVADSDSNSIATFAPLARRDPKQRPASSPTPRKGTNGPSARFLIEDSSSDACPPSSYNVAPIATVFSPDVSMDHPAGIAFDKSGKIYVLNAASQYRGLDNITVYPAGSNANAAPIATIGTDQNAMNSADAIATDSAGEIYVANTLGGADDNGSITIFAPRTNGDATPARTIRGASTGIDDPVGLAIDSSGYLYVLNQSGGPDASGSVTVYSPHSNGDVAPVRTISGIRSSNRTGFDNPSGLALDRSDKIYVTNEGDTDSLTIYAARSEGNVAPIATISGPLTQLAKPNGIAVDSIGNVYVANSASGYGKDPDSITVYPPGSRGNVAPAMRLSNGSILSGAVINGSLTGLDEPVGIALGPGP